MMFPLNEDINKSQHFPLGQYPQNYYDFQSGNYKIPNETPNNFPNNLTNNNNYEKQNMDFNSIDLIQSCFLILPNEPEKANQESKKTVLDHALDNENNINSIKKSIIYGKEEQLKLKEVIQSSVLNQMLLKKSILKDDYISVNIFPQVSESEILSLMKKECISSEQIKNFKEFVLQNFNENLFDKSPNLGNYFNLKDLIEKAYKSLDQTTKKKKEMMFTNKIDYWRHIKGDGNCYYRGIIFRFLHLIILYKDIQRMRQLILDITKCYDDPAIKKRLQVTVNTVIKPPLIKLILFSIYDSMQKKEINKAGLILVKCINKCPLFDFGLILYMRYALFKYIQKNENKLYSMDFPVEIGNLLPSEYETKGGQFLFAQFYENYLLKMFQDAEKIIIYLTPFVLKVKLEILLFDGFQNDYHKVLLFQSPNGGNESEYNIRIINIKNHYELYYKKEDYELIKFYYQESANINNINNINLIDINTNENNYIKENKRLYPPKAYKANINKEISPQCVNCKTKIIQSDINPLTFCNNCLIDLLLQYYRYNFKLYINEYKSNIINGQYQKIREANHPFIVGVNLHVNNKQINSLDLIPYLKMNLNDEDFSKFEFKIQRSICLNCQRDLNNNQIFLPCHCAFCSYNCYNKYLKDFLCRDRHFFYICACNKKYYLRELNTVLQYLNKQNDMDMEIKNLIQIYKKVARNHCGKCIKNISKLPDENVKCIKFNSNKLTLYHYLCKECLPINTNSLYCNICQMMHYGFKKLLD